MSRATNLIAKTKNEMYETDDVIREVEYLLPMGAVTVGAARGILREAGAFEAEIDEIIARVTK